MQWRTSAVVQICEGMREAQDYSNLPILADALEDGDYRDETVLAALRAPQDATSAQRLVALVYSDESCDAVAHLQAFADRVGYSYEKVIEGVREYVATGGQYAGDAGGDWGTPDYNAAWAAQAAFISEDPNSFDPDPARLNEFFTAYERVTGQVVPDLRRGDSPFTCPC